MHYYYYLTTRHRDVDDAKQEHTKGDFTKIDKRVDPFKNVTDLLVHAQVFMPHADPAISLPLPAEFWSRETTFSPQLISQLESDLNW